MTRLTAPCCGPRGRLGLQDAEAEDGEAAIARVREQAYDLVLMDVRMLKVSGLEALAAIKNLNPAIPVVIMTAYSSWRRGGRLKQGAHDYLTKPLDFDKRGSPSSAPWSTPGSKRKTSACARALACSLTAAGSSPRARP